jgi:hypothetical protein
MPIMISIVPLVALLLATAAPVAPATAGARAPVREERRLSVTLSPDLLWLHAGDVTAAPLALRLGLNLTSRIAATASVGFLPSLIEIWQAGVTVDALESAVTPYAGLEVGLLQINSDETADQSESLVLGVLGMSYVARNGFELRAEGAAGREGRPTSAGGNTVLLRAGIRLGWRLGL